MRLIRGIHLLMFIFTGSVAAQNCDSEENLIKYNQDVSRSGEHLTIKTDIGVLSYMNTTIHEVGDRAQRFRLCKQFGDSNGGSYYLISKSYYEGMGYILVNVATGKEYEFSANGDVVALYAGENELTKVAVSSMDLYAEYSSNRLQVIDLKTLTSEWQYDYRNGCGPMNPTWIDETKLAFIENCGGEGPASPDIRRPMMLEYKQGKWHESRELKLVESHYSKNTAHPIDIEFDECLAKDESMNTAGQVNCTQVAAKAWDVELNILYQFVSSKLSDEGKMKLKTSQLAWIKYKDQEYKNIDSIYSDLDGSMYRLMREASILDITKHRALELQTYLSLYEH